MQLRKLGGTGIEIAPLVLGGNVFGWTADRETSFAILDAFVDAGFNAIDTADVYNRYAPGLVGGESETIIGEWLQQRGNRDRVIIITKGGLPMGEGQEGLGQFYLPQACEASLRRLRTDYIDVYLAHAPDPATPIAETLEAFQSLAGRGLIRACGCSNFSTAQVREALAAAGAGRARLGVVEPRYNLAERGEYEGELEALCVAEGLGVVTYYALAAGFLTGKYRSEADIAGRARSRVVSGFMNPEGLALLARLDVVAERHGATPAQVALAWNMARPSVTAPIASATNVGQLADILRAADLELAPEDMRLLDGT
ncbi:aldo/keto reductase [Novosphingobium album (ex Hu et al. 2023)]|uniref:Aldo/keto reductase n=1 Tax=Novosphingobium album (ex Hu et al. 2023) TaxID=2930093 RepID=A0ABT0B818_9SPHN|nr:aldo/keto reductase [Novosphingobium album (ex Hu et al. 2023)]MCJ2181044.1 aldo/keto reductase [Novosphingobium album (ex Hu et al. 2023)]